MIKRTTNYWSMHFVLPWNVINQIEQCSAFLCTNRVEGARGAMVGLGGDVLS